MRKLFFSLLMGFVATAMVGCSASAKQNQQASEDVAYEDYGEYYDYVSIYADEDEDEKMNYPVVSITREEAVALKQKLDAEGRKVTVHNAVELLLAIDDDRKITIDTDDTIHITPALIALMENGYFTQDQFVRDLYNVDADDLSLEGLFLYDNFDGIGVAICNVDNLTIKANKPTLIVSRPRYDDVLKFVNCKDIELDNLIIGHTYEGSCMDGVIGIISSKDIEIKNCDLYGCGTEGITLTKSKDVKCKNVIIRDCSYSILTITESDNVEFEKCYFYHNREFSLINVSPDCNNVVFDEVKIEHNQGVLFDVESDVVFKDCDIQHDGEMGSTEHVIMK